VVQQLPLAASAAEPELVAAAAAAVAVVAVEAEAGSLEVAAGSRLLSAHLLMLQTAPPGLAAGAGVDSGVVEPGLESQNSAEVAAGVAGLVGSSRTPDQGPFSHLILLFWWSA